MEDLVLSVMESFYVGGEIHGVSSPFFGIDEVIVGAMYVQHLAPKQITKPLPVIFLHGGMHTGVTWETTPDGREGWQLLFVRAGFDTYVIDQPWRGRSAPDLRGLMPGVEPKLKAPPAYVSGKRLAHNFDRNGGRFPLDKIDHYSSQLWPDFGVPKAVASGHPGRSDPLALAPLSALLDRIGPAILVTHSQGGHLGWQVTLERPCLVKAIFAVEPAITSPGLDDEAFPEIPVCVMWGDNLPEDAPTLSQKDLEAGMQIASKRPNVRIDYLPAAGIRNNGHMLMMEDNSRELADRAISWISKAVPA
jgi:pimeloyl-ACP methyl ester carboxylesterase